MAQSVKFVDRPGGTVLLDVSAGAASGIRLGEGGVFAPPPPLLRQVAQSPVQDGGLVTAAPFGMRTVTLALVYTAGVRATTALEQAARRTAVTTLMRVLQRERFWLEVIADGATEARYLYCYRTTDDKTMARLEGLGAGWLETSLDILADPFAYGPKETLAALSHTTANDFKQTIAGSGIKGDVPAPCIMSHAADVTAGGYGKTVWVASKVGGATHKAIVEFSALTNGTAPTNTTFTAASATDATKHIGGTADKWDLSLGTSTIPTRMLVGEGLILTTPSGAAAAFHGQYRVFGLFPDGGSDEGFDSWTYELRIVAANGAELLVSSVTTSRDGSGSNVSRNYNVIDFGVIEVPFGGRAVAPGFDGPGTTSPATFRVYASQVARGTPGLGVVRYFDAFAVLPADDTMMQLQYANGTAGRTIIVDPHSATVMVQASGVNVGDVTRTTYQGSVPYVVPGVDVDVFAFKHAGGVGTMAPMINAAADYPFTWTPSYWPRYLTVV